MLPCLNKKLFGIDCLGCGLQRSLLFLIKGDFIKAFHMYPAVYPLLILLLFLGLNFFYTFRYDSYLKMFLIVLTVLTIIVSYIIKMKIFFN